MLKCHQCQTILEEGSQFCANCGAKVSQANPPATPMYGSSYPPAPPLPGRMQQPGTQASWQNTPYNAPYATPPTQPTPRKSPLVPIIIVVAILLVFLIAAVIFFVLRSQSLRLKTLIIEQTATAEQLHHNQTATQEAIADKTSQTEAAASIPTQVPSSQEASPIAPTPVPTQTPETPAVDYAEEARILALIPEDEQWRLTDAKKVEDVSTSQESIYRYDEWLETVWIADSLRSFVLTVTFENPEELRWGEHWDLGILFRHKGGNDQFRIFTTTPDYWELAYVGGTVYNWSVIRGIKGKIPSLNLEPGGKNTIVLIADGDTGAYYINGKLIYNLDLRSRPGSGGIMAWFDYNSKLRDGEKTFFSDIHLWSLDD